MTLVLTLEEYKQRLSSSECRDIKAGLARVVKQGTEYYLVYDYYKLELNRRREYAKRVNVLDPLDALIATAPD